MSFLAPRRSHLGKLDLYILFAARNQLLTPLESVCVACQYRTFYSAKVHNGRTRNKPRDAPVEQSLRYFSSCSRLRKDNIETPETASKPTIASSTVHTVPDEQLPSHREKQRWSLSKRVQTIMDDLMPKLVLASQKINNYTGSDYSGIEALRREIKEQEQLVKSRHASIQDAKASLDAAHARRAASQKEVVGLLERKSSWSATDLERYMSLIRSEHVNDQDVQIANDAVTTAERALDEARIRLEKRERAQYHEEQIWSDTIRRNSTWVTFGLMGVNIAILLVSLVAIEPWRRRRLVREIRSALDEKSLQPLAVGPIESRIDIEKDIDAVVEPVGVLLEDIERDLALKSSALEDHRPFEALDVQHTHTESPSWSMDWVLAHMKGFVSDQQISVRKVDITAIALEAATAGAVLTGLAIMLLRPR